MGQLVGKVALITGASKGVGRVMSRVFAGEGAAVICAARSRDLVEETTALVKADGGRAIAVVGDAAVEADVLRIVQAGVKAFGKLDTLVNNAGDGGPTKPVQDYTAEDWFYTINSCLTSSYMFIWNWVMFEANADRATGRSTFGASAALARDGSEPIMMTLRMCSGV